MSADVAAIVAEYRQNLIAELAAIRAYEHTYEDFDYLAERGRQIRAALADIPTVTELAA